MRKAVLRTKQECEDFVRGLCFMGAGGGGPPKLGLKLLLDQLEAGRGIEWVDIDSLDDEAWTATVAGMGGRGGTGGTEEELAQLGCVEEKHDPLGRMVAAVRALEDYAGVKVEAIVPVEIGASNVPAPMHRATHRVRYLPHKPSLLSSNLSYRLLSTSRPNPHRCLQPLPVQSYLA